MAFLFPASFVGLLNWRDPGTDTFLTSIMCVREDEELCPSVGWKVASVALQTLAILYVYFSTLVLDVLPLTGAKLIAKALEVRRTLKLPPVLLIRFDPCSSSQGKTC